MGLRRQHPEEDSMQIRSIRHLGTWVRLAGTAALVVTGVGLSPGGAGAQTGERVVTVHATCVGAAIDREPFVYVTVSNRSGVPLRVIAVDGFSTGQIYRPSFSAGPVDELLAVAIPDGERVAVDARWSGKAGGDGEGLVGGAVVVTSLGVLTATCGDRPADAGELVVTDPPPRTAQEARLQEARAMAETLGQLESWRAYPLLFALLHPDAQEAVGFDRLQCWYVGEYGLPSEPDERLVFSTTVAAAVVEPWTWEVSGETYEVAVAYDYEQEVGTVAETETVSGTAHLAQEDGVWRWFFGASRDAIDALPRTCGVL
jgi:hypothetical protein